MSLLQLYPAIIESTEEKNSKAKNETMSLLQFYPAIIESTEEKNSKTKNETMSLLQFYPAKIESSEEKNSKANSIPPKLGLGLEGWSQDSYILLHST